MTRDPEFPDHPYGLGDLGAEGQAAIRGWVENGGRYVGWLDGAVLAAGVGISSTTFENAEEAGISLPGALIRTAVARRSPLAHGVGRFAYVFWDSRYIVRANGASVAAAVPGRGDGGLLRLRVRGPRRGARRQRRRRGRARRRRADRGVRLRAELPSVHGRHFAGAAQRDPRRGADRVLGRGRATARAEVRELGAAHDPVRLVVEPGGERAASALLDARSALPRGPLVAFTIANRGGATADESPRALDVASELQRQRVPVVMYRVP